MTAQNYLIIENNVVTNVVFWDGDVNTWQPPADATLLIAATTPAMVWKETTNTPPTFILVEVIGAGNIGFTWDGSVLTTNEPMPTPTTSNSEQPTTGLTTA
jgi:hypothetical protein